MVPKKSRKSAAVKATSKSSQVRRLRRREFKVGPIKYLLPPGVSKGTLEKALQTLSTASVGATGALKRAKTFVRRGSKWQPLHEVIAAAREQTSSKIGPTDLPSNVTEIQPIWGSAAFETRRITP